MTGGVQSLGANAVLDVTYGRRSDTGGVPAAVDFLHYAGPVNIGDDLASPRHYFDFSAALPTLVVGGGASNNFFAKRALQHNARVRILWGVGQSWPFARKPSRIDVGIKGLLRRVTYTRASTRDPALASDKLPLVPCVSVFHPVTELPPGQEVGIVLNDDPRVSADVPALLSHAAALGEGDFVVATNRMAPAAFMEAFARTHTVITNSYHAAYWGLLSGRQVHIIGYSSKFASLAALFGFPEGAVLRVERGDGPALSRAIAASRDRLPLQFTAPQSVRADFRSKNLAFAKGLADVGVTAALKSGDKDCLGGPWNDEAHSAQHRPSLAAAE